MWRRCWTFFYQNLTLQAKQWTRGLAYTFRKRCFKTLFENLGIREIPATNVFHYKRLLRKRVSVLWVLDQYEENYHNPLSEFIGARLPKLFLSVGWNGTAKALVSPTSTSQMQLLSNMKNTIITHSLYSLEPDFSDFFLFRRMNATAKISVSSKSTSQMRLLGGVEWYQRRRAQRWFQ